MRHIRFEEYDVDTKWINTSKTYLEDISLIRDKNERMKKINKCSKHWKKMKDKLILLSRGKCWYCESIPHRSDYHVDHFRPKGEVAECPEHDGYWWLSFDWNNYRLCCTNCNRAAKGDAGGKGNHFPLLDGSPRAMKDVDNISIEYPCLLDPIKPDDPKLLWFDDKGEACPRRKERDALIQHKRALISIKCYNLNDEVIVERRRKLYTDIKKWLKECREQKVRAMRGESVDMRVGILCLENLIKCTKEEAEFSAAAKSFLLGFREEYTELVDEIEDILRTN